MDRHARLKHLLEQLGADLEEMAPLLRQQYEALRKEGVPKRVAVELVKDTQRMLLDQNPDLSHLVDDEEGQGID